MRGGGAHGAGGVGRSPGGVGRSFVGRNGSERVITHGRHRHRNPGNGGFIDPFWYDGYEEPVVEYEAPEESVRPVIMPPPIPEPQRIPSAPKMMEIPGAAKAEASKPLPPAVFILSSGERIESRQYLLTADRVQLTVNRQLRSMPLQSLDLSATLAANRQRGLELRIPAGGSEISLGF
jgi:hypothetical protein